MSHSNTFVDHLAGLALQALGKVEKARSTCQTSSLADLWPINSAAMREIQDKVVSLETEIAALREEIDILRSAQKDFSTPAEK